MFACLAALGFIIGIYLNVYDCQNDSVLNRGSPPKDEYILLHEEIHGMDENSGFRASSIRSSMSEYSSKIDEEEEEEADALINNAVAKNMLDKFMNRDNFKSPTPTKETRSVRGDTPTKETRSVRGDTPTAQSAQFLSPATIASDYSYGYFKSVDGTPINGTPKFHGTQEFDGASE